MNLIDSNWFSAFKSENVSFAIRYLSKIHHFLFCYFITNKCFDEILCRICFEKKKIMKLNAKKKCAMYLKTS